MAMLAPAMFGPGSPFTDPTQFDPMATDPFQPQMGLLQRLLPMLAQAGMLSPQQPQGGPAGGFPAPPSDVSAGRGNMPLPLPGPQGGPAAGPMQPPPLDLATIMESQGSTRPLPYPMTGGGPAQAPMGMPPIQAPQPSPGGPAAQGMLSPMLSPGGGMPGGQAGGRPGGFLGGLGNWLNDNSTTLMMLGAGIAGGKDWGEGISKGLAGAASVQQKQGTDRKALALKQQAYNMLVAQGVPPQKAMLAVMAPDAGKAAGVLGGSTTTDDIKEYEYAKKQGPVGTLADFMTRKRASSAGEYGLQPVY